MLSHVLLVTGWLRWVYFIGIFLVAYSYGLDGGLR